MLTAFTRRPSDLIADCLLTYMDRDPINAAVAREQHAAYEQLLTQLGVRVVSLPPRSDLPDSVFMEDTAVVLDELAVLCAMGDPGRAGETALTEELLGPHREIAHVPPSASLEGGDVFRVGRTLYVGRSTRSNDAGIQALARHIEPLGYEVRAVNVTGCLHLSTGASHLGDGLVLANPEWIDTAALDRHELIAVDPAEPWAANAMLIGDALIMPAECPRTIEKVAKTGRRVEATPISELAKAEAGVTCMRLLFNTEGDLMLNEPETRVIEPAAN